MKQESINLADESLKASLPISVSSLSVAGVGLPDIVYILTAIYTIIQIYVFVRDKLIKKKKGDEDGKTDKQTDDGAST